MVGSIPGMTGGGPGARATGIALPLPGQPVQGVSSLRAAGDGTWWALADNGFGGAANSADALLMIHRLRPDWQNGRVDRLETIFLSDPDGIYPWPLVLGGSDRRYLTGADLDPESLVVTPDGFWIGDEFGPFLLRFDRQGRLVRLWETSVGGHAARSPDHPLVTTPGTPGSPVDFQIARSRGFEGMSASPDGRYLYPLLEGPVYEAGKPETFAGGNARLRLLEFDREAGAWTGRHWTYVPETDNTVIGEFTWIDADRALVIERDSGEGDAARACPSNEPGPGCFSRPAKFKRLYLVTRAGAKEGGSLRKLGYVDLLTLHDPARVARQGGVQVAEGVEPRFGFPFVTIESVEPAGGGSVIIVNDNNLPFSAGRFLDRADDTEFILVSLPELLALH